MLSFACDYLVGAHPKVLQKLVETNLELLPGYGADHYCQSAVKKIKTACGCPEGSVFFLTGGTQTNQIVISTILDSHQGVIAASTGHVSVHEAGAIEYSGHKVLQITAPDSKLHAEQVEAFIAQFYADENHAHMVYPGMVYISFPTEYGKLYTKQELLDLHCVCQKYEIPLYIDGARLGYGIASPECDFTLSELPSLCDVFYIGGTKVGALCGEAVVFPQPNQPAQMLTKIKQRGALLAKSRLLGIQFDALFTDNLYLEISQHAINMAMRLKDLFKQNGYQLYTDSPTNQQFVVLDQKTLKRLESKVQFSFWEQIDAQHTVVRFATSWSTTSADIEQLAQILPKIS